MIGEELRICTTFAVADLLSTETTKHLYSSYGGFLRRQKIERYYMKQNAHILKGTLIVTHFFAVVKRFSQIS